MINENIYKDIKTPKVFKMCNICGCKIKHPNNFKRHLNSRRHNEVDYINNNRFEIERITPKKQRDEIIIIK
jgi:hypothetical protein